MSKPMEISFFVAAPSSQAAHYIAGAARAAGFATYVRKDFDGDLWTCGCSRSMLATHAAILSAQATLDALAKPLGGHSDGWETAGNV